MARSMSERGLLVVVSDDRAGFPIGTRWGGTMLKTWTDTHYQLDHQDWLYVAKHEDQGAASLVCPGYARDGCGFSIHFTPAHIEMLKNLIAVLQSVPTATNPGSQPNPQTTKNDRLPLVESYSEGDRRAISQPENNRANGYKYPAPESNRHLIQ